MNVCLCFRFSMEDVCALKVVFFMLIHVTFIMIFSSSDLSTSRQSHEAVTGLPRLNLANLFFPLQTLLGTRN